MKLVLKVEIYGIRLPIKSKDLPDELLKEIYTLRDYIWEDNTKYCEKIIILLPNAINDILIRINEIR